MTLSLARYRDLIAALGNYLDEYRQAGDASTFARIAERVKETAARLANASCRSATHRDGVRAVGLLTLAATCR